MFPGTLTTGGVVSTTVTVNVLVDEFPCASVALQVTVVAPSGKVVPEAGLQLAATAPSTMSAAEALWPAARRVGPDATLGMFPGTLTTGGVVSWTVTVNVLADEYPCASVALQGTVVAPSGKIEPDAGLQLAATAPSTMSAAEAL